MGDMLEFGLFMGIITSVGLVFRFSHAFIKRMERGGGSRGQLEEMEQRIADLEDNAELSTEAEQRILDLEERLDFSERLLGQQRGPTQITPPADSDA